MPSISIITINFNNIEGLKKTAESVFEQSIKKDIEFIVIDGGSSDGAEAYLNSKDTEIDYWVSEPDKGIFNAMNKGIKKATGVYLLFLNSSDCLNGKTALEDFITHQDFKGDIIYGDLKYLKGNRKFNDKLTPFFFVRSSLPHQATLFKKEIFQEIGYYEEIYKIAADSAFYIKCFLSNNYIFQHIPIELTLFDLSGISNSKKHNKLNQDERTQMLKENYGIYYEDYLMMKEQRIELAKLKANTLPDLILRVYYKLIIYKNRLLYWDSSIT